MRITLTNTTLDIRPGVKLTIEADGTIIIEAATETPEAPKPTPARSSNGATNGHDEEAAALLEDVEPGPLTFASHELEVLENTILEKLLAQPDPYAWRSFAEIFRMVAPHAPTRILGKQTKIYARTQDAVKRLRRSQEIDTRAARGDGGQGKGARARFRLHRDEAQGSIAYVDQHVVQ